VCNLAIRKSIYDYAVELGYTNSDGAKKAQKYADETKCTPQKALIDTAVINENKILELLGKVYHFKTINDMKNLSIDKDLIDKFEIERLIKLKMFPYQNDNTFKVLIVNPLNTLIVEDYIKEVMGKVAGFEYMLISESSFNKYMGNLNGSGSIEYDLDTLDDSEMIGSNNDVYDVTQNDISSIVSLVNKIFWRAVRQKVSDIHIEPFESKMIVRFRIDGILMKCLELPKRVHQQLTNRIKTMANMDINDTRKPQDGRMRLKIYGSHIDMRVSTLPTIFGEKVTLRLLDQNSIKFDISMMAFSPEIEKAFKSIIKKPSGMILITGPTGSGKSSSLYAAISYINEISRCIVTLEDPVEYRLDGLVQVPISNPDLTFAKGLRDTLRQDPDVILIGEIRDEETARIAVQASNTGHLVFSTLHTNNAASAVLRLVEMGVEPFLVATTLNAVVSQRLVRTICPNCKVKYSILSTSPYYKVINCEGEVFAFKGKGCDECNGLGYKGRMVVSEFLIVDDDITEALAKHPTTKQIEDIAIKNGMKTILQDGTDKALAGLTTLDEIHRVLHYNILD